MEPVIVAVGSNVGNRHWHVQAAGRFLASLSEKPVEPSSIYLTEPVGPATRYFLNAAVEITTGLPPDDLISTLKEYEQEHGRPPGHPKWKARTIDLDIIAYNRLLIHKDSLIIPHPEYSKRLFVLRPLRDIHPGWRDPETGADIDEMLTQAPKMQVKKTELAW